MAEIELKRTDKARLLVDYSYSQSGLYSNVTMNLCVETLNGYNIGDWGDYGGSYLHNDNFDGSIPNFSGRRVLHTSHGSFKHNENNGKCSATVGWKWGVRSSWGGFWEESGTFTIDFSDIEVGPTVSISEISHTATTIKIKCSDTNRVNSEKYHIYNGDTFLKETTSKETTLENLTPNTDYSIKAYGYGNERFGPESNTLYIKTSKQSTITSIGDFSINGVKLTLSGEGNIVVIIDGKEVVRRNNVPAGEYELVLTDEEKQKIYELMGNNSSIKAIIRIETGSSYVDKDINITLTGDVFSCNININGAKKRCKVWVGTTKGNRQGIFTIGTSNGNVRGR